MYKFEQEKEKFPVISTPDNMHKLLVTDNLAEVEQYIRLEPYIYDKECKQYIVFEDTRIEPFFLMYGALIRRLAPFKPFDYLYKYFSRTSKLKLVAKAFYIHKKYTDQCPFVVYDPKRHGTAEQLELPHA